MKFKRNEDNGNKNQFIHLFIYGRDFYSDNMKNKIKCDTKK